MKIKILIQEKQVYGRALLYPVNNEAKLFAELIKQKTFKSLHLDLIKALGFKIEVIRDGLVVNI